MKMTEVSARLTKVEYARVWLVEYRMSIGGIGTGDEIIVFVSRSFPILS